jgi:hypothetical protein
MKRALVFVFLLAAGLALLFVLSGEPPWRSRPATGDGPQTAPAGEGIALETLAPGARSELGGARIQPGGRMTVTTEQGARIRGDFEETRPDGSWVLRDVVLSVPVGSAAEGTAEVHARRARGRFAADAAGEIRAEASPIDLEGVSGSWTDPRRSTEPVRFETASAQVELEARRLRAPEGARISMGGATLEGEGLEADLVSGKYRFAREIRFESREAAEHLVASCAGPATLFLEPTDTEAGRIAELELLGDVRIERRLAEERWSARAQRFFARAHLPPRGEARPAQDETPFRLRRLRLEGDTEVEGGFGRLRGTSFDADFDEEGRLERLAVPPGAWVIAAGAGPLATGAGEAGLTFVECLGGLEAWREASAGYEAFLPGPTRIHSPEGILPSVVRGPIVARTDSTAGGAATVESLLAMGGAWLRMGGSFALAPIAEILPVEEGTRLVLGPSPLVELPLPGATAGGRALLSCEGWARILSSPERGSRVEAERAVRIRDEARNVAASGETLRLDEEEGLILEGSPARASLALPEGRFSISAIRIRGGEDRLSGEGDVLLGFPAALFPGPGPSAADPEASATASGRTFEAAIDPKTRALRSAWLEGKVVVDAGEVHAEGDRLDLDRESGEHRLTARDRVFVRASSPGSTLAARAPVATFLERERALVLEPRGTIDAEPAAASAAAGPIPGDAIHATFEGLARLEEGGLRIEGHVFAEGNRGGREPWSLDADSFDARFDEERRVEELRALGDVDFRTGETFEAWADEVTYEPATGIVRGRGSPARFDFGRGDLFAERVHFDSRRRLLLLVERGSIALSR